MKRQNKLLASFLTFLALTFTVICAPVSSMAYGDGDSFNYDLFQQFLDQYSRKDVQIGEFKLTAIDYSKISSEKEKTDSLYSRVLDHFTKVNLSKLSGREEKIAFWINAYNFGAIKMIIDHYPVDSIRSRKINFLKNPWNIKILSIGGSQFALSQIEHDILLAELAEPMAHFGVVCASLSCPNLNTEVYRPENVMNQLAVMAKAFLRDQKKGMVINRSTNEVFFSRIFKFDKKTFPKRAESAIKIFSDHFDPDDHKYLQTHKYKIRYLNYDWSLNAAK